MASLSFALESSLSPGKRVGVITSSGHSPIQLAHLRLASYCPEIWLLTVGQEQHTGLQKPTQSPRLLSAVLKNMVARIWGQLERDKLGLHWESTAEA